MTDAIKYDIDIGIAVTTKGTMLISHKMYDHCSIFSAEATAILKPVYYISNLKEHNYLILTGLLSVLRKIVLTCLINQK